MTPAYAVVLVDYHADDVLGAALDSVAREMASTTWEGVVVDNAAGEASARARTGPSGIHLIANAVNVGFGAGVNQGVAATTAPYILVMNPDCRLDTGAVAAMRAELDAHPACALVGPRILDPDGTPQGSARGDPDMLTGLFGRTGLLRRLLPGIGVSQRNVPAASGQAGTSAVVDWVSGACFMARREALARVGGFDEGYFLYWEDADLCRRLRTAGYEIRHAPQAVAVHQVGQSSRKAKAASIRAFHASAYRYYRTHVAPHPLDPRRIVARVLLAARCWWRLQT